MQRVYGRTQLLGLLSKGDGDGQSIRSLRRVGLHRVVLLRVVAGGGAPRLQREAPVTLYHLRILISKYGPDARVSMFFPERRRRS